jgi:hypothetical protein
MRRVISIVAVALVALVVVAAAIALLWPALGRSIWWQVYAYRWWISPWSSGGPGPARLAVHRLPAAPDRLDLAEQRPHGRQRPR